MTRAQLHKIFQRKRNYGESARIARELDVCRSTILQWFKGRVDSARISQAIHARGVELLNRNKQPKTGDGSSRSSDLPV